MGIGVISDLSLNRLSFIPFGLLALVGTGLVLTKNNWLLRCKGKASQSFRRVRKHLGIEQDNFGEKNFKKGLEKSFLRKLRTRTAYLTQRDLYGAGH